MDKSLFGIDMDMDGRVSALDDLLFMHMVENGTRSNKSSMELDDAFGDDDFDVDEEDDENDIWESQDEPSGDSAAFSAPNSSLSINNDQTHGITIDILVNPSTKALNDVLKPIDSYVPYIDSRLTNNANSAESWKNVLTPKSSDSLYVDSVLSKHDDSDFYHQPNPKERYNPNYEADTVYHSDRPSRSFYYQGEVPVFSEEWISRRVSVERVKSRGKSLYCRHHVLSFFVDNNYYHGLVHGDADKKYNCWFALDEDGSILDWNCECNAFKKYPKACKHLVALFYEAAVNQTNSAKGGKR